MSYFPIDTDNEKLIKEDKGNISMNDERKQSVNHARHVKPHSEETRKLISKKQQDRYNLMRELIGRGQNAVTEERIRDIVAETIERYLNNNIVKEQEQR